MSNGFFLSSLSLTKKKKKRKTKVGPFHHDAEWLHLPLCSDYQCNRMHTLEWKRNSLMFGRCTKQFHLGKVHPLTRCFHHCLEHQDGQNVPIQKKDRAVVYVCPLCVLELVFFATPEADTHQRNLHVHRCSGAHELGSGAQELGSARLSTLTSLPLES